MFSFDWHRLTLFEAFAFSFRFVLALHFVHSCFTTSPIHKQLNSKLKRTLYAGNVRERVRMRYETMKSQNVNIKLLFLFIDLIIQSTFSYLYLFSSLLLSDSGMDVCMFFIFTRVDLWLWIFVEAIEVGHKINKLKKKMRISGVGKKRFEKILIQNKNEFCFVFWVEVWSIFFILHVAIRGASVRRRCSMNMNYVEICEWIKKRRAENNT